MRVCAPDRIAATSRRTRLSGHSLKKVFEHRNKFAHGGKALIDRAAIQEDIKAVSEFYDFLKAIP